MGLTEKQQRFADYYIQLGNATQAAIKAGYSEHSARYVGNENLTKPYISDYIEKRLGEMASERIAEATEVMETLTRVLRREEKEVIVVTCKTRVSDYDKNDKKRIIEQEEPRLVEIPTKISDVNKAAELLGKRYGLYTDKVDLSGDVVLELIVDYGDDGN